MGALGWIVSIVGVTGALGFLALMFAAPLVASKIVQAALTILEAILSTRIGCAALAGAACLLVGLLWGDHNGASRVRTEWADARAAAKIAADKKDADTAKKAAQTDQANTAAEVATDQSDKEARDAYVKELEKRAAAVCLDTDADVERLRPR